MKAKPTPVAPSDADTERHDNAVRKMFTASKEETQRHEALWKKMQGNRQTQGDKPQTKKS